MKTPVLKEAKAILLYDSSLFFTKLWSYTPLLSVLQTFLPWTFHGVINNTWLIVYNDICHIIFIGNDRQRCEEIFNVYSSVNFSRP